ncbi:MAG: protein kinase [Xanthomonadales bacterium]|nr:protein kinase [Xanthomonadales bacterium]
MKTHLGHYEIESELGRGGMGVVYKAFEPALNRHVAIKELSPSLAHDPQLVERFLREARAMAALSDPHIIQIFYIGTDEATSQPFFAMEFVDGDSLSSVLKRDGKLDPATALKVLHQTAQGLATAHDRGVIHRDIKPGNLMLTTRGQVKIADFGIALATTDISKKLTSTGEFVGTPGYLSPEVCLGKPIDQRSDIFSLGIVLFEMLSGRIPFGDESPLGLMLEVVKAEIPDIQQLNDQVDAATAAILTRMVAKEPAQRFQSCHDLVAALEAHPALAQGPTIKISRPAAINAATVVGTPAPKSIPRVVTPPPIVRAGATPPPAPPVPPAPPAAPAAKADVGHQTRPSALNRPAKAGSSRWIPVAVAAALVLMLGGGAFAFRGQIMGFVQGFGDGFVGSTETAYEAGRNTGKASNPIATSHAAEPAPTGAAPTSVAATTLSASATSLPDASTSASTAMAQDRASAASSQIAVEAVPAVSLAASQPVASPVASAATAATEMPAVTSSEHSTSATSAPVASKVVASTAPPRPVTPPTPQRVAVVALGDSAITGPARSRIESELSAAGFDLADADVVGVSNGDSLASALNALRRSATIVVVVRAEPVGSQQLNYYGRSSELYIANLSVRAYKTSDRSPVGGTLVEKVQFTALNADTQAQAALDGKLERLVGELAPYRRHRG